MTRNLLLQQPSEALAKEGDLLLVISFALSTPGTLVKLLYLVQ